MAIPVKTGQNKSMPPKPVSVASGTGVQLGPGIFPAKEINFIEHRGKKDYHMPNSFRTSCGFSVKKGGTSCTDTALFPIKKASVIEAHLF
jgi:hypothetical protein